MITQERLKELFDYNPETGDFLRKIKVGTRSNINDIAGCKHSNGYIYIVIDYKQYRAHRLVWLYYYGHFPEHAIDHINHIKHDNSLLNLREATHSENSINRFRHRKSKSGFKCVYWNATNKKWQASTQFNSKYIFLGLFDTAEETSNAYQEFAKNNHGEFLCSV
jgi:hypothetical protein